MPMLTQDVTNKARSLINDPSGTARWSDSTLIGFYNDAANILIRDVEFPESRLTTTTVANQQEYSTPALIKVYRVYVNGQLLVPTTLQVLEGHQIQEYDQGLSSGILQPGTQTPGSGGPPGTTGTYTPAWNIQTPQSYPVSNSWNGISPDAQPWFVGQRPRYYWRGGFIGLVPAPLIASTLVIDALIVPTDSTMLTDASIFPTSYRLALAWKIAALCKFADDDDRAGQQAQMAEMSYEKEMRKLRAARKQYDGDQPRMPKFRTYRGQFNIGNNRNAGSGFEYP